MKKRSVIFYILGLVMSVVPPILAILLYFPLWISEGGIRAVSGFTLLLLVIALVPFFKVIKRLISSPTAPIMWLILFVLFFTLSAIADEMAVISLVGFLSNLIGDIFFRLSGRKGGEVKNGEGQD